MPDTRYSGETRAHLSSEQDRGENWQLLRERDSEREAKSKGNTDETIDGRTRNDRAKTRRKGRRSAERSDSTRGRDSDGDKDSGEIVGKTAELTDTISTRQMITKAQFSSEIPQVLCLFCL